MCKNPLYDQKAAMTRDMIDYVEVILIKEKPWSEQSCPPLFK